MLRLEEWKELVIAPTKTIPKLAGKFPVSETIFKLLATMLVVSAVMAFGSSGKALRLLFRMGEAEFFIAALLYFTISGVIGYGLLHFIARALGGNGKFSDLVGFWAMYSFPIIVLPVASLIPYIGGLFLVANGLAGLYAFWIQFKVLRLVYGLSRGRAIATYASYFIIMGILGFAFFMAAVFPTMFFGGETPIIRDTGAGYHFYSQLHGGYSFDYPYGWKSVFQDAPTNGTAGIFTGMMRNEFFSMDILAEKSTNKNLAVAFYVNTAGRGLICDKKIAEQGSGRVDASDAEVSEVKWGGMDGCLIENLKNRGNKATSTLYVTDECAEGSSYLTMVIMTPGSDYQPMKKIVETLKCGKDAIK